MPTWGTWPLGSVAHSDVATWLAELSDSGLRPGTVRQVHRVLSLILDAAVQDGRIGRNPAAGVRLPRQVRSEPRFLTADEVARLAAAAGPSGLTVLVLSFTGLRFGELAALKVRRVDFERRRLYGGRERDGGRRPVGVVDAEDARNQVGPGATVARRAAPGGLRRQER